MGIKKLGPYLRKHNIGVSTKTLAHYANLQDVHRRADPNV